MFYEEKIIDGVLHYRNDPKGEWVAHSSQSLTIQLQDTRTALRETRERLARHAAVLHRIKKIFDEGK